MDFNAVLSKFKQFTNSRIISRGAPFFIFVLGGSFLLREWAQVRYQFSSAKSVSRAEAEKMGLKEMREQSVSLEETYEEIKTLDIDNWENKRGPRAWENNSINKK